MNDIAASVLREGTVIPAVPLALKLPEGSRPAIDERRQRALLRYYSAAGVGGVAVGVHTTQFEIRDPGVDLLEPVIRLAADEAHQLNRHRGLPLVLIAGVAGVTDQAVAEARLAADCGYDAALVSLAALSDATDAELLKHCAAVGRAAPVIGFYLQPAVGGRHLSYDFWRAFCDIQSVVAIKMAPFDRYRTLDVIRAVIDSGRTDIALYTGNDDSIIVDLVTPFRLGTAADGATGERRVRGGLLGHWSVWTKTAAELFARARKEAAAGAISNALLALAAQVTDANGAFFDAAQGFGGCIVGLHEVLRRQGLLEHVAVLEPGRVLTAAQAAEIDRVYAAYPHLNDDAFVRANLDEWLT